MLFAVNVLALELGSVLPGFDTVAVLFIFLPVSLVGGAVQVEVLAFSVRFVLFPASGENVSVRVDETSFSLSHIISPVAFENRPVRPVLCSAAVFETSFPLSDVDCSAFEKMGS